MSFIEIVIKANSKYVEVISDFAFEHDILSVSVEDQYFGTELEQAMFGEPGMKIESMWEQSLVTLLFNQSDDYAEFIKNLQQYIGVNFEYEVHHVDDQDWVRLTQSQFEPIKVVDHLYITPSWHYQNNPKITEIILDPGLAFGTGSHPTTFMCLSYLAQKVNSRTTVLDYGCGSGILAITAARLGALLSIGVDIDPQAIESSYNNAKINQVESDFYLTEQIEIAMPNQVFDIVVANILANPLRMLAGLLAKYTRRGGTLVLSGILDSQIEELSTIYSQWCDVNVYQLSEGWVCLECIKR